MADLLDQLRLVQWLSPAFPIGGFAYSQGLEAAISDGLISDGNSLSQWLQSVLRFGSGRMDALFVAHALDPHTDIAGLADLALAYAGSAERAQEMTEQGRAFGTTVAALLRVPQPQLPYAVALGYAARNLHLDTPVVLGLYLQAFASQLTAAAVKFVPLGQTVGQKVLTDLGPDLVKLAALYATTPLSGLGSASFGAELAQMRHETMDVRIFRS
jgi:urease accessory protein